MYHTDGCTWILCTVSCQVLLLSHFSLIFVFTPLGKQNFVFPSECFIAVGASVPSPSKSFFLSPERHSSPGRGPPRERRQSSKRRCDRTVFPFFSLENRSSTCGGRTERKMRAKRMLHLSLNQGSLARSVVAALCLWAQQSGTTGGPRGLGSGSQLTAALGVGGVFLSGPLKPREPSSALNQAFSRQSVASEAVVWLFFLFLLLLHRIHEWLKESPAQCGAFRGLMPTRKWVILYIESCTIQHARLL